jgi:hypothetical protein
VIKSEQPDAVVALSIAGVDPAGLEATGSRVDDSIKKRGGIPFLEAALKNGVGPYFDVLDIHTQGTADKYKNLGTFVSTYNNIFIKHGMKPKPIWNTEFGTYDGNPPEDPLLPLARSNLQDETMQASGLIKKYVHSLSVGIQKIFWTTMVEWSCYTMIPGNCKNKDGTLVDSYFSHVGLINNLDNPDGLSHKKLAYYSYKKMVEVLEGSAWNKIQMIQNAGGIYIYKVTKNNKPIWVAWNDNTGSKQVTISGINANQVKITEAVPKYKSGKEVSDYSKAFNGETKAVDHGTITITLKDVPVFVE